MDCKTRSGRIVRGRNESQGKTVTSLQLYIMSLSEGSLLKCNVTLLQFKIHYKCLFRAYPGTRFARSVRCLARILHRCSRCTDTVRGFGASPFPTTLINVGSWVLGFGKGYRRFSVMGRQRQLVLLGFQPDSVRRLFNSRL